MRISNSNSSIATERNLIITADDFGASRNINEGIIKALENRAITTISALTNFGESLPELKALSMTYPEIGIGVHLNIVTGKPLMDGEAVTSLINTNGCFYSLEQLIKRIGKVSIEELRLELEAQIRALSEHNILVDHLSDHCGILSMYSPFFEIVVELAQEYNIPVRSPVLAGFQYPDSFSNSNIKNKGRRLVCGLAIAAPLKVLGLVKYCNVGEMKRKQSELKLLNIAHPDIFVESFWGDPSKANFERILYNLPQGTSEIVVHLGTNTRSGNYPSGLDIDYFESREKELETLINPDIHIAIESFGIKKVCFRDLKLNQL